jgi:hypothetical protein
MIKEPSGRGNGLPGGFSQAASPKASVTAMGLFLRQGVRDEDKILERGH